MKLNGKVIIDNICDCPDYYSKYIKQTGKIVCIDILSVPGMELCLVEFDNDLELHGELLNDFSIRPKQVKFSDYNLKGVIL